MSKKMYNTERPDGRSAKELRSLSLVLDAFGHADSSVLFEVGGTKVLASVSLQNSIPHFMRGSKKGWLTAEYAMLPTATKTRTTRESVSGKRSGRSVEISRLIGRSLRAITNLVALGEKTIQVDCDVLQADGGTRTASITAACMALHIAVRRWIDRGVLDSYILTDLVAAVSVGVARNNVLLDVDYAEDSALDADYNYVLSRSGRVVEIQGSAEGKTTSWEQIDIAREYAQSGVKHLFNLYDEIIDPALLKSATRQLAKKQSKPSLFSLGNR